ncbi:MAG TPA: zinc ribbon domain-containing protein [Gemmatimonadaceae bacterium]|nr:zinc ribbon domain-containing protein [Gemmatimonadaceae bacterium]
MPTYEYRCPAGHDFERFYRKISDAESVAACPVCGAQAERRMSAGAGLIFKGSGFYITDYGKDGKKPQGKAPSTGSSKGEGAAPASGSDAKGGGGGEGTTAAAPAEGSTTKGSGGKKPPASSSSGSSE